VAKNLPYAKKRKKAAYQANTVNPSSFVTKINLLNLVLSLQSSQVKIRIPNF
jgi:hypothetical protein